MAFFGLFKSNEEKMLDNIMKDMNLKIFPNGDADLIRDCTKINKITNGKIPPDLLRGFVSGCKCLLAVSEDNQDEARFISSFIRRSDGLINEKEAKYMYVYFSGEVNYYDNVALHFKKIGSAVPAEMTTQFISIASTYNAGVDSDSLPTGYGEFGLVVSNPIPTISIQGSNSYLSKLRYKGQSVSQKRLGSTSSEVTEGSIDIYNLSIADLVVGTVYICPYHKRNSNKSPVGFSLKS